MRLSAGTRRAIGYAALVVVLYALFLVVTLPARWIGWALAGQPAAVVRLDDAYGTVWKGRGKLGVRQTGAELGVLTWHVKPLWLLSGRLKMAWNVGGYGLEGGSIVTLTYGQTQIQNLTFTLPASGAERFYPPARVFGPEGTITLSGTGLTIRRGKFEGSMTVRWQDAGSQRYGLTRLGQYQVTAQGEGESVRLALTTVRGDLELVGQGQWNLLGNGRLQLRGTARALARQDELEPLLRLLGTDVGGGRRAFSADLPLGRITPPGT